uniref:Protein kinase domain-containing protein n=1 Tax=Rhabditophanes sp. KR3021 TaxID=114890 RepID=A0AC35UEQ4_9BILA
MIYIGEKDANTEALLQANYGKVFKDIYILPKSACVSSLNNCMSPCHTLNKDDCTSHTDFTTCVDPGVLPTAGNETLSVPDDLEKTQHVAYVFALSNSSKMEDYTILQKFIGLSVTSCFHHANEPISVILVTSHPKSKWEETAGDITNTIDQQPFESVIINITTYPTDQETTVTNEMILNAADFLDAAAEARGKRIVLMTDFISMKFYEDFKDSNKFISSGIEVDIYALNEDTFNFYKTNFSTNFRNVFNIEFHTNPPTMPIQICRIKPTEAPTTPKPKESADVALILIITCGTCAVLLIILEHKNESSRPDNEEPGDIFEVTWEQIFHSEKLGTGAYGQVYKGTFIGIPKAVEKIWKSPLSATMFGDSMPIAIKMMPKYAEADAKKDFLNEIEIMKRIGYHEYIVGMVGCITKSSPNALLMEYCQNKDLHHYLLQMKTSMQLSNNSLQQQIMYRKDLLVFGWQIANGLAHLHKLGFCHRDIATRNILIDDKLNAKIGDFGLCIEDHNKIDQAQARKLPIKWLALESLKYQEFSRKSDIWAFGIVMVEMYTFGGVPFNNVEPKDMIKHLEDGKRPEKPEFCTEEIFALMKRCWLENSEERPSFDELLTQFIILLERTEGDGYLTLISPTSEYYQDLAGILEEEEKAKVFDKNKHLKSHETIHSTRSVNESDVDYGNRLASVVRSKTIGNNKMLPEITSRGSRLSQISLFKSVSWKTPNKQTIALSPTSEEPARRKSESIVSTHSSSIAPSFAQWRKSVAVSTSKLFNTKK